MGRNCVIPVSEETRSELRDLKNHYGMSYNGLVKELLEESDRFDVSELDRPVRVTDPVGGREHRDSPEEALDLLNKYTSGDYERMASDIIEVGFDKGVCNRRSDRVIVGGAIYLACQYMNEDKTQSELSELLNVSKGSIRQCYKGLHEAWHGKYVY